MRFSLDDIVMVDGLARVIFHSFEMYIYFFFLGDRFK